MITVTKKIDFIRSVFGKTKVDNSAQNVAVLCPSCGNKTDKLKFSINIETWKSNCWVCGLKTKNLYHIIKKFHSYELALEFKEKFGLKITDSHTENKDSICEKLLLPEGFCLLGDNFLSRDPDIRDCIRYLLSRNVTKPDIWRLCLGTAKVGKYRRKIIFPSFDSSGELNYFVARTIDDNPGRKYVNANAKKSEIIFNEYSINWKEQITIVEGPFDLIKCGLNAVCILGSSLSKNSYLFKRLAHNQTPVCLALDYDMKEKIQKISKLLSSYGCEVKIVEVSKDQDIGSMSKNDVSNAIENAQLWSRNDSLLQKINSISSGSIF